MHLVRNPHTSQHDKPGLSVTLEKLKERVAKERVRAPPHVQEKAFTRLWDFAELRKTTTDGLNDMAPLLREGAPLPEDLRFRLSKILVATFLMDKMAELRDAVMKDPTTAKVELFQLTRSEIARILSREYFHKSIPRVRKEYFRAEPALIACAECCSVPFEPSESAMRKQADKADRLMDEF